MASKTNKSEMKEAPKSLNEQLMDACKEQDIDMVKDLISKGAEASYVYKKEGTWGAYDKYSVLHTAITSLQDERSATDEHKVVWKDIIFTLLKNGADPNECRESYDWRGCGSKNTSLDLVSMVTNSSEPDIFKAFLEAGLNPNLSQVQDISSMRTDGTIVTHLLHDLSKSGSVDCVVALLNNPDAKVDIRSRESINNERGYREEKSQTPFHVAVLNDHIEVCVLLLAKGADINAIEDHIDSEMIKEIADKNITDNPRDVLYKNPWKNIPIKCTALHLAIKEENYDMAKFLIACGADLEIPYKKGNAESISCSDLLKSGNKKPDEVLQEALKQMNVKSLIDSLQPEYKKRVLNMLTKIQELGWEFDVCNFREMENILKSSLD